MNAIIIVARLESERLTQKHLKIVEGLPLIKWLTKRIESFFKEEIEAGLKLFIATPATELNKKFEDLYKDDTVKIFRGDEKNVPLRIMQCCDEYIIEKVVIADGDNFLISMEAIKAVYKELLDGDLMVKTEGLPLGMNVMGWDAAYLKSIMSKRNYQSLETGWGRIFTNSEITKIHYNYTSVPQFHELRFTTDYPEDFRFMKNVFQTLGNKILETSSDEIIKVVIDNKFYEINGYLYKTYFENFYKKMEEEKEFNHET
jgi:spore coat polysaccharide biosynthesis protein SpsF